MHVLIISSIKIIANLFPSISEHKAPGEEKIKLPDTVDRDEVDELDDPPSTVCYFIVYGNENGQFRLEPETHVLTVLKELDREEKSNHTLIIKATENCSEVPKNISLPFGVNDLDKVAYHSPLTRMQNSKFDLFNRYKHSRSLRHIVDDNLLQSEPYFQSLISGALGEDGTLVQVIVYVEDINDNPPEFVSKVFTGGITTAADFGLTIMHVRAIDRDDGLNAVVNYYQIGEIHKTLAEGLDQLSRPPFLVDQRTGAVLLNFDPQKGMKGYFDFMVRRSMKSSGGSAIGF